MHHGLQRPVADIAHRYRPRRIDVVIQPLECKAVEIDKIAGHVDADYVTPIRDFDSAQDIAVDQDGAAIGFHRTGQQPVPVIIIVYGLDQTFDVGKIVLRQIVAKPSGEEIPGRWIRSFSWYVRPHVHVRAVKPRDRVRSIDGC